MPVVLATPKLWVAWLDAAMDSTAVRGLLGLELPGERMTVRPANPLVNSAVNEGPHCIAGIETAA